MAQRSMYVVLPSEQKEYHVEQVYCFFSKTLYLGSQSSWLAQPLSLFFPRTESSVNHMIPFIFSQDPHFDALVTNCDKR